MNSRKEGRKPPFSRSVSPLLLLFLPVFALFVFLRLQRVSNPPVTLADEAVYLHVAAHLARGDGPTASWLFIPRGDLYLAEEADEKAGRGALSFEGPVEKGTASRKPPSGPPPGPLPQSLVQTGLPLLLAPVALSEEALVRGRAVVFMLAFLSLLLFAYAAWKTLGPLAAFACALFTTLSFSQTEYGALVHTETPMSLVFAALWALLAHHPVRPHRKDGSSDGREPAGIGSGSGFPFRFEFGSGSRFGFGFLLGAVSALGLYFRTNGIFLPLGLAAALFLHRVKTPRVFPGALCGMAVVAGPPLLLSTLQFGSPLASASGDIFWAPSEAAFRAARALPFTAEGFLSRYGWEGLRDRLLTGGHRLLVRLFEMDHGRNIPLLLLGILGVFRYRRHFWLQALLLGTLPTLAVTVWVLAVSDVERFLHFLFPLLYALGGKALEDGLRRLLPLARRGLSARRISGLVTQGFPWAVLLALALPYYYPHAAEQRRLHRQAREAETPAMRRERALAAAEIERVLKEKGAGWVMSDIFPLHHFASPVPGMRFPGPGGLGLVQTTPDSVGTLCERALTGFGRVPTHAVIAKGEPFPGEGVPVLPLRNKYYSLLLLSCPE